MRVRLAVRLYVVDGAELVVYARRRHGRGTGALDDRGRVAEERTVLVSEREVLRLIEVQVVIAPQAKTARVVVADIQRQRSLQAELAPDPRELRAVAEVGAQRGRQV